MSTVDYRPIWEELGLDLVKHDALLDVLGKAYQELFLSQKNRPEGMKYFDFVMSEVHGLRIKELVDAKKEGRVVVGSFCVFVPEELILAVDGISVGLCAGAEFGTEAAEQYVPRNTCALIKSAFGFVKERVCPYIAASDLIVGENTCDGKKKSYEQFKDLVPSFYAMDLPQTKSEASIGLLRTEYRRFAERLEALSGRPITIDGLKKGIEIVNAKRQAMHRLGELRKANPAPISGMDALLINQVFFYDDPVRFTASVNALCDELETRIAEKKGVVDETTPRLVVSGCPMAVPNWKMHSIVESSGAVVVADESCVGDRGTQNLTRNEGDSIDALLDAVTERYSKIDCAIFTPNPTRMEYVKDLAAKTQAKGVLHYSLQFCTPYQMEAGPSEKKLEEQGIPTLLIDTDYSAGDAEQLRTRVEAFLERING